MGKIWGKENKEKRLRFLRLFVVIFAACAALLALAALAVDSRHVRFYMLESEEITAAYGKPFVDPGCYAVRAGRFSGEGEEELPVEVTGQVDTDALGDYELRYTARYHLRSYSTTRLVHVADLTPPEILLEHTEGYEPTWFTGYEEEGYSAVDDYDGDLTGRVETFYYEDRVEYRVSDAAGNEAVAVRPIEYSLGRPEIYLNGGDTVELTARLDYQDPGYSAYDIQGNDLTGYIQTSGDVVSYRPGSYEVVYTITNALGDTVSVARTVNIVPAPEIETVMPEGNVIYLTFDDGPGPYTARLLNVLARYNAKATFFVTCIDPDYADLVGRAYREGHSIGVHSATHNYYSIYASEEAFLDDFRQTEEMIYQQTGSYTRLFRFPGGSSNTVSSFNPGIMSRLRQIMLDMGYQYFDWDVSSGDAGETTKTTAVVDNIIGGCAGRRNTIVLQHDIKDFSVAAVEKVLSWGARNGYTFLPLEVNSPAAHHGIAN